MDDDQSVGDRINYPDSLSKALKSRASKSNIVQWTGSNTTGAEESPTPSPTYDVREPEPAPDDQPTKAALKKRQSDLNQTYPAEEP